MNTEMTRLWNEVVKPEDTVWILGDWCMGDRQKTGLYAEKVNGRKILIAGNHDKLKYCYGVFDVVLFKLAMYGRDLPCPTLLIHDPADVRVDELDKMGIKLVLNGHVHEKWPFQLRKDVLFLNVGVDAGRGFQPKTLPQLIDSVPGEVIQQWQDQVTKA